MLEEIKIGIADDHKIFRKGVILSMRQYTNIKFVFEAENGDELMKQIPEHMPDRRYQSHYKTIPRYKSNCTYDV
jgi:hypothetical protein